MRKSDEQFFKFMRVTKKTFIELTEKLQQTDRFDQPRRQGPTPTSASTAVAVTLWYLGNLSSQREISEIFHISQGQLSKTVKCVVDFLCSMSGEVIRWPTVAEMAHIETEFKVLANFPGTVGAIDGCHIPILAPEYCQADYLDRNHNHSVNLMAVCDSAKRFTYCFAGYPGSVHDQRVFSNSALGIMLDACPSKYIPSNFYHIIGDSAFQLHQNLLVPYKDTGNLTPTEINYNTKLSQTRRVIENTFGLLKGRFRRLKKLECALSRVSSNIMACCILHNLTIMDDRETSLLANEVVDCPSQESTSHDARGLPGLPTSAARQKRDTVARNLLQ